MLLLAYHGLVNFIEQRLPTIMRSTGQSSQRSSRKRNTESTTSEQEQRAFQNIPTSQSTKLWNLETTAALHRRKANSQQQTTDSLIARTISTRTSLWTLLFVAVLFCSGAVAQERVHPALQKAAIKELLFDRSPAPDSPHRRALIERATTTAAPSTISATATLIETTYSETVSGTAAVSSVVASASSAAATSTGIATAPGTGKGTLPQPFDTSLGNNFTSSACPAYFTKFLADSTFQTCYPFSLLLQVSVVSRFESGHF